MIGRISGELVEVRGGAGLIQPPGGGPAYEVLLPAYLASTLERANPVTLTTLQYWESQGQGSSYIPRLLGFRSAQEREFFELLTSVRGLGNRKALRAMAIEPSRMAEAIASRDLTMLKTLPEIGKKLAETLIAELGEKVGPFLPAGALESKPGGRASGPGAGATGLGSRAAEEAAAALVALGQTRGEAEEAVSRAIRKLGPKAAADEIVASAVGG